jgi:hypothetical protein
VCGFGPGRTPSLSPDRSSAHAIEKSEETRKRLAGLLGMQVFGSGRMTTAAIAVELLPNHGGIFIGHGRGGVAGQDRQDLEG